MCISVVAMAEQTLGILGAGALPCESLWELQEIALLHAKHSEATRL